MKNKILLVLTIFMVILAISCYIVYQYRSNIIENKKINNQYKSYYQAQVLGTELVSIINETEDINSKNEILKNDEGLYIDNQENSIKMYIEFIYKDEYKVLEIEKILKDGIENFIKNYGAQSFKCTKITYHEKTKNVKEITFTEINN